jgi:hypothetical protein
MRDNDDPSAAGADPGVTPTLVRRREFLIAGARTLQQFQTVKARPKRQEATHDFPPSP